MKNSRVKPAKAWPVEGWRPPGKRGTGMKNFRVKPAQGGAMQGWVTSSKDGQWG